MNSRTELMIGVNNINKYSKKHIAIFGVGGVGGYADSVVIRAHTEIGGPTNKIVINKPYIKIYIMPKNTIIRKKLMKSR